MPVARVAPRFVGIDRSEPMLRQLRARIRRARLTGKASIVRGDIRVLPFRRRWRCRLVMAPYGMLQSLLSDEDLAATLEAVAGCCRAARRSASTSCRSCRAGRSTTAGWGCAGAERTPVTLIEPGRLTVFDQEFPSGAGGVGPSAFRTGAAGGELERAGFRPLTRASPAADVWVIIAREVDAGGG